MSTILVRHFKTRLGLMGIVETADGISFILLPPTDENHLKSVIAKKYPDSIVITGGEENKKAELQINEYLSGTRKIFNLRLDLKGAPFQVKVLKEVAAIPYGKTESYGRIAAAVGNPNASRAVGSANAKNPLPIVIPCHRVVAGNGLGGYGGGINMKIELLSLEKSHI